MASRQNTYFPSQAGPKQKNKYPFTGANYEQYGEIPGYVYYPWSDEYYVDPKSVQQYQVDTGQAEAPKKPPGLAEALIPVAGAALAYEGGKALGSSLPGMLGAGSTTTAVAPAATQGTTTIGADLAATQAAAPVAQTGTTTGTGMLGLQSSGAGTVPAAPTGLSGTSGSSVATPAASGTPLFEIGAPSYAGYAGAAFEGYNAYKTLTDDNKTDQQKAQRAQQQAALGVADIYTAGLASAAEGAARKYAPHFMSELDKLDAKTNPLTLAFQDSNKWKTEKRRINKLASDGVYIPENIIATYETLKPSKREDQVNKEVAPDFIGFNNGQWVNNKWLTSGDEKDLRPEDIVNYAAFVEADPDWFNKPLTERLSIANTALKSGAVTEEHGSITVKGNKLKDYLEVNPNPEVYNPMEGNPSLGASTPPAPTGANPPKGTRLSPGVYADGKGGSYRA